MSMQIRRLNTTDADFDEALTQLLDWDTGTGAGVPETVASVLADVQARGDQAVLELTSKFDRLEADDLAALKLSPETLQAALDRIDAPSRLALEKAGQRITDYHQHQKESSWRFTDDLGNELGQKITPLSRVGVYVPGGQASYPSSVLMTLLPAKVAGVEEIVVTVPTPDGKRSDMVLAALAIAGADEVYTIGGAQAVGAMAYGTQTIGRVDKIVGPGGAYVAEAKRQVYGKVGIDVIAGPSEILVIADGSTNPEWVAMDLFSQAEHDADAQSILLSPDPKFMQAVWDAMQRLLPTMARKEVITASLAARGGFIQTRDLAEAIDVANRIAPEHLELQVEDPDAWIEQIKHAGAIFCGAYSGETLGDYVAGPSHVLPTFGTARFGSPLGVYDFIKRSSIIRIAPQAAADLVDIALPLANSEGLEAHARAAAIRAEQQPE
ncbi:MAG: histidinol dehydrogenase [Pseudomonadota bacterium]